MDIHFHYYGIRSLAWLAGFPEDEAETIAYASQYVDDATEHKGIHIRGLPVVADEQHIAGLFEPVCTAHQGLQYLSFGRPDVQRKIYISFHFVPPATHSPGADYEYRVRPGAALATELLRATLTTFDRARGEDRLRALIKTGIALHAYADTWAHQGFSGRWNSADNDIQRRSLLRDDGWHDMSFFEQLGLDALPDIGHVEAGRLPDGSSYRWRYHHEGTSQDVVRDNPAEFTTAAETILAALVPVSGDAARPHDPAAVRRCLEAGAGQSRTVWGHAFPGAFANGLDYSPTRWRREALDAPTYDWERYGVDDFRALDCKAKQDVKWFLFHVEAGVQRDFILRRIRYDLA